MGNLIALPLQGNALKVGNSAFVDRNWNAYPDQWEILWSKPKLSKEFVESKIREWKSSIADTECVEDNEDREKPWEKNRKFSNADVDGKLLQIILGHSTIQLTMNLYCHVTDDMLISEMSKFENGANENTEDVIPINGFKVV